MSRDGVGVGVQVGFDRVVWEDRVGSAGSGGEVGREIQLQTLRKPSLTALLDESLILISIFQANILRSCVAMVLLFQVQQVQQLMLFQRVVLLHRQLLRV